MPSAALVKVMLVDDQASMRALTRQALTGLGFRDIRDSASATEALDALRSAPAHVILSDYNMPGMNGLEFLEAVRGDQLLARCVFIMLTGAAEQEVVQRAVELKVNNFIVKPFTPQALKERIERVIGPLT